MPPQTHARLSASAAHRWMQCPAAPRLEEQFPDESSPDADLGTAAHALGEMCLRAYKDTGDRAQADPALHLGETITVESGATFVVDEEMVFNVQLYVGTVLGYLASLGLGPEALHVERKLDALRRIHKDLGGTPDAVIVQLWGRLVVFDYKNGFGYVEVIDNSQMKNCGFGALLEFADLSDFEEVDTVIVQPRCSAEPKVRSATYGVEELLAWGHGDLVTAAKAASRKTAKPCAGLWCRWCKAAGQCPAVVDHAAEQAMTVFSPVDPTKQPASPPPDPALIPIDKLGLVLEAAEMIAAWVKAVQHRVDQLLANGDVAPEQIGWKRVWGRATSKWLDNADAQIVKTVEEQGVEEPYIQTLKTYAVLRDEIAARLTEKGTYRTKKAAKERAEAILAGLITTNRGTSLVPIADKREAIQPAITAFTPAGEE